MSRYQQAISEFKEILKTQPPEPYAGRKRRPNGYRDQPEYRQWQQDRKKWAGKLLDWHRYGIDVYGDALEAKVTLYGETVTGTAYRKQPAGWILYDADQPLYERPERCEEWAPKVRMPGARESLDLVFEHDHKKSLHWWYLKHRIQNMTERQEIRVYSEFMLNNKNEDGLREYEKELEVICGRARTRWAEAVRILLDPGAVTRLRKWTGQKAEHNLLNYNLAVAGAGPLSEAAKTNPGALAWWMRDLEERSERWHSREEKPPLPPIPKHPGEIIARVKTEYAAAGGKRWKALASQPASHVAAMLERHGRKATVWLTEAISEAAPPEPAPPPAPPEPEPAPPPAPPEPEPAEQLLFGAIPAPKRKPPRTRSRPAPPARPQAPPEIKLMLLELYNQNQGKDRRGRHKELLGNRMPRFMRPEEEKARTTLALRRLAVLSLREYAGAEIPGPPGGPRQRITAEFEDLVDYLFNDPKGAARAGTWKGLKKASRRWHGERNLEILRQNLAKEAEEKAGMLSGWETPIRSWESENGFRALVLNSAQELILESRKLSHCVGGVGYADLCRTGETRIVHLEPAKEIPDEDQTPLKERGTTLQIDYGPNGWQPGQHRGYANRSPDDEEAGWAKEFMTVWKQAIAERKKKLLEQEAEEEEDDEEAEETP